MSGSHFLQFWVMLGSLWEYCGHVFGWVWDGFEKQFQKCWKMMIFRIDREYFSCIGGKKLRVFSLFPDRKDDKNLKSIFGKFYIKFHDFSIYSRSTAPAANMLLFTLLHLCVSSLRRCHANLLCIVPI